MRNILQDFQLHFSHNACVTEYRTLKPFVEQKTFLTHTQLTCSAEDKIKQGGRPNFQQWQAHPNFGNFTSPKLAPISLNSEKRLAEYCLFYGFNFNDSYICIL